MNMTGNFGHVDKDVHGQRYEFDTRGVVVGLDGAVTDNLVLGAGFAYGHAKVNTRFLGTAKASSYQAIGYGRWQKGGSYLNGIVSAGIDRSEEHTSELQSLVRISYAVFCLKKTMLLP